MPRIRLFLWKFIYEALPVRGTHATRLRLTSPVCSLCGQDAEEAIHALFTCQFVQAYWYRSPLVLRSSCLPRHSTNLLFELCKSLQGANFTCFANLIQAIWKARCSHIMEGKKLDVQSIYQSAGYYDSLSKMSSRMIIPGPLRHLWWLNEVQSSEGITCYKDGSFSPTQDDGWAYVIWWGGSCYKMGYKVVKLHLQWEQKSKP